MTPPTPPCLKPKPKGGLITPTNPTTEVHPWPHNLIRVTFAATTPPLIRAVLIVLIRLAVVIHTIVGTTHEQGRWEWLGGDGGGTLKNNEKY